MCSRRSPGEGDDTGLVATGPPGYYEAEFVRFARGFAPCGALWRWLGTPGVDRCCDQVSTPERRPVHGGRQMSAADRTLGVEEAARVCGVSGETIRRRLRASLLSNTVREAGAIPRWALLTAAGLAVCTAGQPSPLTDAVEVCDGTAPTATPLTCPHAPASGSLRHRWEVERSGQGPKTHGLVKASQRRWVLRSTIAQTHTPNDTSIQTVPRP